MTMLGAQLGDLVDLKAELSTTNGEVAQVSSDSVLATTNVVTAVTDAAAAALSAIDLAMGNLNRTVAASMTKAANTQWTGANQTSFINAYTEFQKAMGLAETSTTETFKSFNTSIGAMTTELDAYKASLTNALTSAQTSVTSMEAAVQGQHDNLDQVMNQGLTVS